MTRTKIGNLTREFEGRIKSEYQDELLSDKLRAYVAARELGIRDGSVRPVAPARRAIGRAHGMLRRLNPSFGERLLHFLER